MENVDLLDEFFVSPVDIRNRVASDVAIAELKHLVSAVCDNCQCVACQSSGCNK